MLTSLALIFLIGLALAGLCQWLHLPRIMGMLFTGILLGPYVLNLLDPTILAVSDALREMALIIILIKAGLSLNLADLKKVGRPALLMSFLPALCELGAFLLLGPVLLDLSLLESAIMGAVMGAVSPAVVVPKMVHLMEEGYGTDKSIPQLILAGASLDDVFVIVLFSTFVRMEQGGSVAISDFTKIPLSIFSGILLGVVVGWLMAAFFETAFSHNRLIRNSVKVILVLAAAFLLTAAEDWLEHIFPVSGLLAVMGMACMLQRKCPEFVSGRLSEKFGKLWLAAEVILFVLVGAAVDIRYTLDAGLAALAVLLIALAFRSLGVLLCLAKPPLKFKERMFCVIAYLPKATVQAAIGSVPLALGLPCGMLVLSVAVLSILITAPLGALGMDLSYKTLLCRDNLTT
jgi:NhaP-type Na+/H+ or K+/H+ antiporter